MSLMAGFDLVIELAKPAMLKLIEANFQINGTTLTPPFELDIPLSGGGLEGVAYINVTTLTLDLFGTRSIKLGLQFAKSAVLATNSAPLTLSLLDGVLYISAELNLRDVPAPNTKAVGVDFSTAIVDLQFTTASQTAIKNGLAGTPVSSATFVTLASDQAAIFIKGLGVQVLANPQFLVIPGMFGSISQARFERLEIDNFGDQAVCLAGMLLPGKPVGIFELKTVLGLDPSRDIAVAVGAEAFHRLIFCPSIADNAGVAVSALPTSCGSGSGITQNGATLTAMSEQFAAGWIDLNGTLEKSSTCYDARCTFHGTVTLSFFNGQLTANLFMDQPSIEVDIPWYCYLVGILLGPLGLVIYAVVKSNIDSATAQIDATAKTMSGQTSAVFGTSSLDQVTFDQVRVDPEAIVLNGGVTLVEPARNAPSVEIAGSVTRSRFQSDGDRRGTYYVADGCMQGHYPTLEVMQELIGTFGAIPHLMAQPVVMSWYVFGNTGKPKSKVSPHPPLSPPQGAVTVPQIGSHYPFPLPGGSVIVQDVHLGYEISDLTGNLIKLTNDPVEGIFSVFLQVVAVGADGAVATAVKLVQFDGDYLVIGGDYQARLIACHDRLRNAGNQVRQSGRVPPWVVANYPPPELLNAFFVKLFAVDTPATDELLLQAKLAHGSSFYRTLFASGTAPNPAGVVAAPFPPSLR